MSPMSLGSRRRARRVAVTLAGTLVGKPSRPVTVVDLSLTGCLLRTDAALHRGSIHDLEFPLRDAAIKTKARVTEMSKDGAAQAAAYLIGVQFLEMNAKHEAALRAYLAGLRRTDAT
jgi:c-di-GMP-binding flagellar brake protein YcgR